MKNYTLNLKISGITCSACIKLISKKIGGIAGVTQVDIAGNNGETIIVSDCELKISDIASSLQGLPYQVQGVK